jgi:putative ABC transport system permease protein
VRQFLARLVGSVTRRRNESRLKEEIEEHLALQTADNIKAGLPPEEARRQAVLKFGAVEAVKESYRDQRGLLLFEQFLQDVRFALRRLRRNPAYSAMIVLVLALGIGANALIFSMINVVLLMRFPYSDAERLVLVQTINLKGTPGPVAPANFVDWRQEARSFEYLSAKLDWNGYDLTGPEGPQQVIGVPVTAGIFEMLGVRPQLGRTFGPSDDRPESARVAILSDRLWTTRYKRDSGIIGRTIIVNGLSYTVIGVMPPGFYLNRDVTIAANVDQLWVPYASQSGRDMSRRNASNLRVWGQLKPGVTLEQAQAEMNVINARLQQAYPDTNAGRGVVVSPLSEFRADRAKRAGDVLMLLMGAVSFVLLIACANVANLQLARAAAQQRDLAIRTALGASRLRIVRQLMTEMLLLALVGGAASLLVAWWAQQLVMTFLPENLPVPRLDRLTVDRPVVLFALGAAMLSGIVAGLVPAAQLSSREGTGGTNDVLKAAGRGLTGDRRDRRLRHMLVISEVAVAMILLVGAGLLIRSLLLLQQTEPGFDPTNVLTVRIPTLDQPQNFTSEQEKQRDVVVTAMLQRIQGLPRVDSAAMVQGLPTVGIIYPDAIILEQDPAVKATAIGRVVSPDYFDVMRIPLKAGRLLRPSDTESSPRVVVIDETLAARYFSNTDPIGQRLRWQGQERSSPFATIVGVVGAVRDTSIRDELSPEIYESYLQVNSHPIDALQTTLVIRGPQATALATPVRSEIAAVSPNQSIPQIQSMEQVLRSSLAAERFNARMLTGLAALALILAATGIFGVISYSVARRTHEIGVRMALGARGWQVLRLVLRQGLLIALVGVVAGAVGALFLTRLLVSFMHDVSPTDPFTFVTVALLLMGVALVACYVPARRASRVDPLVALRYE